MVSVNVLSMRFIILKIVFYFKLISGYLKQKQQGKEQPSQLTGGE